MHRAFKPMFRFPRFYRKLREPGSKKLCDSCRIVPGVSARSEELNAYKQNADPGLKCKPLVPMGIYPESHTCKLS